MNEQPHDDPRSPEPIEYTRPRGGWFRRAARVTAVALAAFVAMFIPIFFAGGSSFEQPKTVWWAWPATGAVAVPLGACAVWLRKSRPQVSAGIWIGIGLGLLLAGMCFSGM
jgi:hypothetical protein